MHPVLNFAATFLGGARLRRAVALLLCVFASTAIAENIDFSKRVAIHSWTLRELNFDQLIEFAKQQGITELQLSGKHIDYLKETPEQLAEKKAKLEAAGLHVYTHGVANTSTNKVENRKLFEFCKYMGFKLVVVEPHDFSIWDDLEELAKEFDIKVAVHNHGVKSLYGNPLVVRQILMHRDARLGVCMDIGHLAGSGFDVARVYKEYDGRVFDIHLKDKKVENTIGDQVATDTLLGEGRANFTGLFKLLQETGYPGMLALETDSAEFARDPTEFVAKGRLFVETMGR